MEKKSAISIGISIVIGFLILGGAIIYSFKHFTENDIVNKNRYEMISPNDSNIIIFDKETGRYWRKFIKSNEGPTDWTEETIDFLNE
ncbi:hypothetical protein K5V21_00985 [Clostridium sardiniense]|uniref:Uncharacterized protein n=1 Tax=Clostridium sardiniense TaxID=29369 RepID=A0ABS7KT82_CLOSR|nr:hypothetical protein [Clostridium sardiniense]MBY0754019.1 hypothetical protein [Clostridium sardiniense]MDQ0459464.1 ABC-type lipoprotein release transport system permease subunit [Clostridium sardiniense]